MDDELLTADEVAARLRATPRFVRRLVSERRIEFVKVGRLARFGPAILNTSVREDEILKLNPCRIQGYDRYHTPERPVATVAQVLALAEQMPSRYVALITVAAFSGLRWGELAALRRCDVDLAAGTVRVPRKLAALKSGLEFGPPKSAAGIRVVALPAVARKALTEHLGEFAGMNSEALVFAGDKDMPLRTGNFRRAVKWSKALADAGMPAGFHFHDLRHTGNNIAAASGASTRELMHRMGHASMRAALIYQHATSERDREVAASMDKRITKGTKSGKPAKDPAGKPAKDASGKRAKRSKPTDGEAGGGKPGKRGRDASPDA